MRGSEGRSMKESSDSKLNRSAVSHGLEPPSDDSHLTGKPDNLFDELQAPSNPRIKQVWAIGGGKGGVGKSLVASNLSIALSQTGNHVIGVDLDLGGSN